MEELEKLEYVDLNKENLEKIKEIFPQIISEDKIDVDALKILIGDENVGDKERYEFIWPDKYKASREAQKKSKGTLRPCIEKSKNWYETENIYIEGDNLEVLKLLQNSYREKIKIMYIDPPYNTKKDRIYRDDYSDNLSNYLELYNKKDSNKETSGRYHTNWLNMMYPRLKLARDLLREDGVIFISIDDHELFNLKKVCDEIFGENNCILTTIINRPSQIGTEFSILKHEYLLIYCKNHRHIKLSGNEKYSISRGTVGNQDQTTPIIEFPAGLRCEGIEDGIYKTTRQKENSKENITNHDDIIVENGILKKPVRLQARWRSSNDMRNFFNNNCQPTKAKINGVIEEIWLKSDRFIPQIKKRVTEKIPSLYLENKKGSLDLDALFDKKIFDFPKSVNFIEHFISLFSEPNDIILDFFSGSSSTAHAIFNLNIHTKKNNKFIMVQLPLKTKEDSPIYKQGFKTICDIGEERIRRAGEKILDENPDDNIDIGFKVFKLASSNFKEWNPSKNDLNVHVKNMVNNIKKDRNDLDLVYEILLKLGMDLSEPVQKIETDKYNFYSVSKALLLICFDNNVEMDVANEIIEIIENTGLYEDSKQDNIIVFKDNCFGDSQNGDSIKANTLQKLKNYGIEHIKLY